MVGWFLFPEFGTAKQQDRNLTDTDLMATLCDSGFESINKTLLETASHSMGVPLSSRATLGLGFLFSFSQESGNCTSIYRFVIASQHTSPVRMSSEEGHSFLRRWNTLNATQKTENPDGGKIMISTVIPVPLKRKPSEFWSFQNENSGGKKKLKCFETFYFASTLCRRKATDFQFRSA